MGLLSIFKRQSDAPRGAIAGSDAAATVQQARVKARQRLIGAAVLVAIGVIGFPLLFESTPRPIPVNIPIESPSQVGAPPLAMPPGRDAQGGPSGATASPAAPASAVSPAPIEAAKPVEAAPVEPARAPAVIVPAAPPKAAAAVPASPPPVVAPAKPAETADGARAKALLEGKAAARTEKAAKERAAKDSAAKDRANKDAGRFVVQVGAFSDKDAAQSVRKKVEAAGLKTYTQVVDTAAGKRVRVRIGPFNSREEAERAQAKAKAGGFNTVVMPL
jgi:DedD protein